MAAKKKRQDPFREIQNCLQKRDYKSALGWFQTLLERENKNTQIRLRYADTLVLAGSKNEAIKQYRIVADELAESGFMIRAIAINKKIVQLDPRQTDVHQKLAEMNETRSKGRSAAMAQLSSALVSDPAVEMPPASPSSTPPLPAAAEPPPEPQLEAEAPAEPTMSLEDSLAMEFGSSPAQGTTESPGESPVEEGPVIEDEIAMEQGPATADLPELTQPVDSPEPGSAEPPEAMSDPTFESLPPVMEDVAEDDDLILLDEDEASGPLLIEEEKDVEITLDATPPGLEDESQGFEIVAESEVEIPAADADSGPDIEFELADGGPSFSEGQPLEGQEALESEEAAVDYVLDSADDLGDVEEGPDVEFDIEMEPDAAADGADPLVGVLGEDIDALIDFYY